jgi:amino acid transporter
MGEEAVSASRRVPRAMIQGLVWAVLLGWFALIGFTLAIPSVGSVEASDQPLLAIGGFWLGSGLLKVFVAFVLIAMFSLMVSGLAAEGRLLYGLARDNMLPGSRQLARISDRSRTPVVALVVEAVLIAAAIIYGALQPNAFGTLVGATSFLPFAIYALVLIAYLVRHRQLKALPGSFDLGRWGIPLGVLALAWSIAVAAAMSLPADFHGGDKVVIGGAVVAALWYALVLYRRIRSGDAGVRRLETVEAAAPSPLASSAAADSRALGAEGEAAATPDDPGTLLAGN